MRMRLCLLVACSLWTTRAISEEKGPCDKLLEEKLASHDALIRQLSAHALQQGETIRRLQASLDRVNAHIKIDEETKGSDALLARRVLVADASAGDQTIISHNFVKTHLVNTTALLVYGLDVYEALSSLQETVVQLVTRTLPTASPSAAPTALPSMQPFPLPTAMPTPMPTPIWPGRDAAHPASSGMQLKVRGDPSGWYWVRPSGAWNSYYMYVDNDRNGGGWILTARVTVASGQAHCSNAAVNFDGTNGPSTTQTSTCKVSDSWMNDLRAASTYAGTTAYWMESTGTWVESGQGPHHTFIDSRATVDLVSSASDQDYRTILSTTFEGSLSNRNPNSGTRGFGDHHTSSGVYFAYQRHPEQGSNYGFSEDVLGNGPGGSDGLLWVK